MKWTGPSIHREHILGLFHAPFAIATSWPIPSILLPSQAPTLNRRLDEPIITYHLPLPIWHTAHLYLESLRASIVIADTSSARVVPIGLQLANRISMLLLSNTTLLDALQPRID